MIIKQNQTLKTSDLIGLMALVGLVLAISGAIVFQEVRGIDRMMALNEAENLAFQLVHSGFSSTPNSERSPAAVRENLRINENLGVFKNTGEIGKDPWGHPFRYNVVRNPLGKAIYVVVWSAGPNAVVETNEQALQVGLDRRVQDIEFAGDDFGYIHQIDSKSNQIEI